MDLCARGDHGSRLVIGKRPLLLTLRALDRGARRWVRRDPPPPNPKRFNEVSDRQITAERQAERDSRWVHVRHVARLETDGHPSDPDAR